MLYYLRIEGVNLYSFLNDTQDLSTIRGGGLLLLHSIERIKEKFPNLNPITTGASNGLFSFEAEDDRKAEEQRKTVAELLTGDHDLRHATFVVDVQRADKGFLQDKEAVLARNRWRQWQQPTVVVPEFNQNRNIPVCIVDRVRPGTEKRTVKNEPNQAVSASVAVRRDYGIGQKQHFYASEMEKYFGINFDRRYVHDLDSLTNDPDQGNLHHKMAVIYLDGNSFGAIQRKHCGTEKDQQDFDKLMKKNRASALKSLLEKMGGDTGYQIKTKDGVLLRMETLLWGGDELVWVVPAWKGWNVLGEFYRIANSWKFSGESLTHAAGMVFCHHNAPVHRIVQLCKSLAEKAKETNRTQNLFQYLVLESFDHIGRDLEAFRNIQCSVPWKVSLEGERMLDMAEELRKFKETFPRNKVFAGVHAALANARPQGGGPFHLDRFKERLRKTLPPEINDVTNIHAKFGDYWGDRDSPGLWLHLADLWDYIPEEKL